MCSCFTSIAQVTEGRADVSVNSLQLIVSINHIIRRLEGVQIDIQKLEEGLKAASNFGIY
jgi:hypothetical protein